MAKRSVTFTQDELDAVDAAGERTAVDYIAEVLTRQGFDTSKPMTMLMTYEQDVDPSGSGGTLDIQL